jgi:hypothetical protein
MQTLLQKHVFYALNIVPIMIDMIKFIYLKWLKGKFCPFCAFQKVSMSYLTKLIKKRSNQIMSIIGFRVYHLKL